MSSVKSFRNKITKWKKNQRYNDHTLENHRKLTNYRIRDKHNIRDKSLETKWWIQRWRTKRKWPLSSSVLIPLIMLNMTGQTTGGDVISPRMLSSIFGSSKTCTYGNEVLACTLAMTCWFSGGIQVKDCEGSWLYICCVPKKIYFRHDFDDSSTFSDWKMVPPVPHQVPPRTVTPNNVLRRRADDDVTQLECGVSGSRKFSKRIIGGREALFAEFPWQAHVRISEFQCGGVLVSKLYVATAAHCVSRSKAHNIVVWLGALDTSIGSPTGGSRSARKVGVVQKILHPLFQFRITQPDRYDLALLKLSRPMSFTNHILPICLPDYSLKLRGRSGVIAGWGKTDASSSHAGTNLLRSATVPILSTEQCLKWHMSKQISVEIHPEMICAGHSDGHQDACLGDSGGPLIVMDNGKYYLVGITSAGFGCGVDHQPGIYHNVKVTSAWIRAVIGDKKKFIDALAL